MRRETTVTSSAVAIPTPGSHPRIAGETHRGPPGTVDPAARALRCLEASRHDERVSRALAPRQSCLEQIGRDFGRARYFAVRLAGISHRHGATRKTLYSVSARPSHSRRRLPIFGRSVESIVLEPKHAPR